MKNDMPPRHKTLKKVIAAALLLLIAAAVFFIWYYLRTWPLRFHAEFDAFFGKGTKSLSREPSSAIADSFMATISSMLYKRIPDST